MIPEASLLGRVAKSAGSETRPVAGGGGFVRACRLDPANGSADYVGVRDGCMDCLLVIGS